MTVGRVEVVLSYTGDQATVEGALNEMMANARQRALMSEAGFPGTAAEVPMYAEAVTIDEATGTKTRLSAFHVNPAAPDADAWGIVDGRLPHEPAPETPPPPAVGAWADATPYAINDEVTWNGNTYRCISAHTSNLTAGWTPAVGSLWTQI